MERHHTRGTEPNCLFRSAKSPKPVSPTVIVAVVVAAMTACVLGLVVWKALDSRASALAQGERDIRNLTHSLAEHASHSIQAADVAMSGMVDILKYQRPRADRFNLFLRNTVAALPQIREIAVLDADGRLDLLLGRRRRRATATPIAATSSRIAIRPILRCGSASGCGRG